ncbi:fasciclin domain-containing protein [Sulfitobacter sp. LCG007]
MLATLGACATQLSRPGNIVSVASADDRFSALVAAVSAAGLVETLEGDGPFTVFAPTDAAFDALPAATVENLLRPENKDQLVSILTYHVVPGYYPARALALTRGPLTTAQGGTVFVDGTIGVRVDNAKVIVPDVAASNGVIHAIDRVLLP